MADDADQGSDPSRDGADLSRTAARAYERDRYLAALLAPVAARADLIVLAAFAGEMARIPSYVEEPMMGLVRLQWWRDALGLPPTDRTGHPIADELRAAVVRHRLPRQELVGVIEAHTERLEDAAIPDEPALSRFIDATQTAQFRLAWRVLAASPEAEPPDLLDQVGQAYGRARVLVELPAQLAERRLLIPAARLDAFAFTIDSLRAGSDPQRARALLRELAADVQHRLHDIRPRFRHAPRDLRTAILPAALIEPYLRALERSGEDPRAVGDVAPLTRVWRVWKAHRLGRI